MILLRSAILFTLLVVVPAAVLSALALRVADREHAESLRGLREGLESEADAVAKRARDALAAGADRAEAELRRVIGELAAGRDMPADALVAWVRRDTPVRFSPSVAPAAPLDVGSDGAPVPETESRRLFELSVRGGERFELARGDPAAAIDAYSFYLPRIDEPRLRDRLRFRVARAAVAAGERSLGAAILRALVEERTGAVTGEGYPIVLLSARLLGELGELAGLEEAARESLSRWAPRLSGAPLLALARALAPGDERLRRLVADRARLEGEITAHADALLARGAVFTGEAVLIARPAPGSDLTSIVARADVEIPDLATGELEVVLAPSTGSRTPDLDSGAGTTAVRPVELERGPVLAILTVRDGALDDRLGSLDLRRAINRALVGLLVAVTLAGGIALAIFFARERHLVRLREQLLANVSHELKTPITSIRMLSEMLADGPHDAARSRRFGQLLLAESLRLLRTVENVLDFSRMARRKDGDPIGGEPVDLRELVERVAADFAPRAADRDAEIDLAPAAEGEPGLVVMTNPAAVERIVGNLIENALKYHGEERPRVELALERHGDRVRVSVSDNGPGIPAREQQRIFDEFYRARFENYAVQGSGLGLSIARGLARRLGGDLTVSSRQGQGSTFTLELPAGDAPETADTGGSRDAATETGTVAESTDRGRTNGLDNGTGDGTDDATTGRPIDRPIEAGRGANPRRRG